MKRLVFAAAAALPMLAASPAMAKDHKSHMAAGTDHAARHALMQAAAAEWRGDDRARDQHRHPVETLMFFGVRPGMTVVDYFASPGWYAKILVPYLGEEGTYIGAIKTLSFASEKARATQDAFAETFPRDLGAEMDAAGVTGRARFLGLNTNAIPEKMKGTADRVLIFRMMHNVKRWNLAHEELGNIRSLLKDDGMLGIVQHRAKDDASYDYANGDNGYLRQDDVIKLVEAHGFKLVGMSEINANPRDTADHDGGVWQIPPIWSSKDEAKKAIGESDRMTLLFKKAG